MSLISPVDPTTSTLNLLSVALNRGITQRVNTYNQIFNLIWNNAQGLTPQEVVAALGTNAAVLFALAAQEQSILPAAVAQVNPVATVSLPSPPAGWTVTPNADGSVALTPPPS